MVLFSLAQATSSITFNAIQPLASLVVQIYDLEPVTVNIAYLGFLLMHPIFTFPASFIIERYGTYIGIFIGSIFTIIGVCMRCLIDRSFYFVMLGNVLAGIGRPFIVNSQTKIGLNWFYPQDRPQITGFLSFVVVASTLLGPLIPVAYFVNYTK